MINHWARCHLADFIIGLSYTGHVLGKNEARMHLFLCTHKMSIKHKEIRIHQPCVQLIGLSLKFLIHISYSIPTFAYDINAHCVHDKLWQNRDSSISTSLTMTKLSHVHMRHQLRIPVGSRAPRSLSRNELDKLHHTNPGTPKCIHICANFDI